MMHGIFILNKRKKFLILVLIVMAITFGGRFFIKCNKYCNESSIMKSYLEQIGIRNYNVLLKSDYKKIKYLHVAKSISKDDIQKYIDDDLESKEIQKEVKNRNYVKKGDVICVDFTTYCDGKVVNDVSDETFMVGKNKFNTQIERNIIGKKKGEKVSFYIKVPIDDSNRKYAGKKERVEMIVKSIITIKSFKLNKAFIKKFYNFSSIDEYYDYVEKELQEKNDYEIRMEEQQDIQKKVEECFDIKLSKEEVARYSLEIVNEYGEIASIYNMTLHEFINKKLKLTEDEFMIKCYHEGETRIKEYIAIGAVAKLEKVKINEDKRSKEELAYLMIDKTISYIKQKYLKGNIK